MAEELRQYLRIGVRGVEYLLPSTASVAIEKREGLETVNKNSTLVAWRRARTGRWPAYCVAGDLSPSFYMDWQRVVFLSAHPQPVGLVADEIQMMPQAALDIAVFVPPGPPPTSAGHLFSGAWVDDSDVVLVLEPNALAAYLQSLGG